MQIATSFTLRPFNFKIDSPESRKHAVQYLARPATDGKSSAKISPGKNAEPAMFPSLTRPGGLRPRNHPRRSSSACT